MGNGQEAAKKNKGSMWERGKEKRNNGERLPRGLNRGDFMNNDGWGFQNTA